MFCGFLAVLVLPSSCLDVAYPKGCGQVVIYHRPEHLGWPSTEWFLSRTHEAFDLFGPSCPKVTLPAILLPTSGQSTQPDYGKRTAFYRFVTRDSVDSLPITKIWCRRPYRADVLSNLFCDGQLTSLVRVLPFCCCSSLANG